MWSLCLSHPVQGVMGREEINSEPEGGYPEGFET